MQGMIVELIATIATEHGRWKESTKMDSKDNHTLEAGTTPDGPVSRQEEAFNFVTQTFIKLIDRDKMIGHKKEVMAFYHDLFEHKGVRNNMIQAFSNFLWELDSKMDAARRAGMQQIKDAINKADLESVDVDDLKKVLNMIIDEQLQSENAPEEKPLTESEVENMDLSEVGGGDEDDTPLL